MRMQPLRGIELRRVQIEQERAARMAGRANHVSSSTKSDGTASSQQIQSLAVPTQVQSTHMLDTHRISNLRNANPSDDSITVGSNRSGVLGGVSGFTGETFQAATVLGPSGEGPVPLSALVPDIRAQYKNYEMGAQLREQAYRVRNRSIPRTKSSPRPPRKNRAHCRSSVLQDTGLLPSSSPTLPARPPPQAATAKAPSEVLLQIAEFALMAPKEIIDFPYLGNHMNSPTANFEMAEMGSLGVHLGNFLLVCRDFMAVGYDAFLRMNTFAFTCVGAFGQFDRFLSQGKIAEYRGKVRKLRFFMFAKTSDPVPIISTHMGSLRKFKWLTHVHFDFAALEIGCWMLSTDEKKQEWLTMLTHFSKHVTTSSKALIHVTGFPSGEMKDAFLTTLMTMMKSDQDHIVPDNGCLNYEKKGRPSKWIVSRILDVK